MNSSTKVLRRITTIFCASICPIATSNPLNNQQQIPLVRRRGTSFYWPFRLPTSQCQKPHSIFDSDSESYQESQLWSELHDAAYTNNIPKLREAINNGIPVDNQDFYGQTPLWWASSKSSFTAVKVLVEELNADVNKPDYQGVTPLHANAGSNASADVLTYLINNGANFRAHDQFGNTPLHTLACENNIVNSETNALAKMRARAISHLYYTGYIKNHDFTVKNNDGDTPYAVAVKDKTFGHTQIAFEKCLGITSDK